MRWRTARRSTNVEDRRDQAPGLGGLGFPGPGRRLARRGLGGGLGTIVIVLAALYFGVDPTVLLQGGGSGAPQTAQRAPARGSSADAELVDFVKVVLADTEDVWQEMFRRQGHRYEEPKLVLFSGAVRSACGLAEAAMGPFYCPGDHKVYIDLAFYRDMKTRFGAPGDFAQAYVVAHEVGHHVQTLLGTSERVSREKRGLGEAEANRLSVRQELQADCFAGLWARQAERSRNILEQGDLEEALGAAQAIGDDRLQRQARGYVTPDSFTHGSSAQRVRWFKRGFEQGTLDACDTFGVARL